MNAAVAIVTAVLLLAAGPTAAESSEETRVAEGTGSLSADTDVEFFLVEGTYRHELGSPCLAAASLFPADREPAAPLSDVLQADLQTAGGAPDVGSLTITAAGWVNLQVGTGPECDWSYAITGRFLPLGEEPPPPRAPDDLGGLWGVVILVAVAAILLAAVIRRGPRGALDREEDEPQVKVTPLE